ncbi:hypothetical protein [Paraburkholderia sp. RL17-337-BIB-A]|uniref:hypothetical protein n=1 Tax=Paraburkholderia sp. RL17-337-BIB-A TaxID=3031636 RepID=UPI0038B8ADC8
MNNNGSFVISSMPDYSELLANAEANVARVSDAVKLTHLQTLADTSDERYFRALMESTMRQDPHWPGYSFETSLGSQWRCRIIEVRLDRLLPLMKDMWQVATYCESDRKRIFRLAGMPQRFKYDFTRCVQFARTAVDIVKNGGVGSLHALFSRFIRVDGWDQQPELRAALVGTFKGLDSEQADSIIRELGLTCDVTPPGVLILQRLGVVSGGDTLRLPSEAECREAVTFYDKVSVATGKPFRYVEAVFSSNFTWSHLDALRWSSRKALCVGDAPACNVCAHASYCAKNGVAELVESGCGWLSQYSDFYGNLAGSGSTLGRLPSTASEAVLLALRHQNAIWWQAPVAMPREEKFSSARASLVDIPVDALLEAYARRAGTGLPVDHALEECMPETWPVGELVGRRVPCLLDSPPTMLLAGEGDALLAEYVRRGHATVPLLAVNWRDVADAVDR